MKVFTIGQVLSACTGKLLCPMGELYEILNFLHSDNLFSHQLPRAMRDAQPWLHESLPWLDGISCDEVTRENYRDSLNHYEAKHGTLHSLEPIPRNGELKRNPVAELVEIVGKNLVIVVDPGNG